MNRLPNLASPEIGRRPFQPSRQKGRAGNQIPHPREHPVQLVYAYLPPAMVLAADQHLRAQTRIEQRAQQLWLSSVGLPADVVNNWLNAEHEVVSELCRALSLPTQPQPELAALHTDFA